MNPIYQAPILERLKDIEKAVQHAIKCAQECPTSLPLTGDTGHSDELKPGEIAIWDWVIRPRFREEK